MKSQRVVAVRIPRTSVLKGRLLTNGPLTRSTTVGTYASRVAGAVVTINGSVFDPTRGALPVWSVQQGGKAIKGSTTEKGVIALGPDRKAFLDRMRLSGSAKARGYAWPVAGLNWGSVTGSEINVYTTRWGTVARPYGTVDVVVSGGKVVARRTGTSRGQAPKAGQVVLTATGTAGSQLSALRVGDPVSLSYRLVSASGRTVVDAIVRGYRYLHEGKVDGSGSCSTHDEQLRPRTAVG